MDLIDGACKNAEAGVMVHRRDSSDPDAIQTRTASIKLTGGANGERSVTGSC